MANNKLQSISTEVVMPLFKDTTVGRGLGCVVVKALRY
jgi:hypothetical protein